MIAKILNETETKLIDAFRAKSALEDCRAELEESYANGGRKGDLEDHVIFHEDMKALDRVQDILKRRVDQLNDDLPHDFDPSSFVENVPAKDESDVVGDWLKDIDELYEIERATEEMIEALFSTANEGRAADELGLDSRAGYSLVFSDEWIATKSNDLKALEYYGGFEYLDADQRKTFGEWTFFFPNGEEGCRVQECLDFAKENS